MAIDEFGGPELLHLADLPDPVVGPDVVLVRARAAGVNPVDYKVRKGGLANRYPCDFPLVPGWDVAGVVEATGSAVPELSEGDEVVGYVRRDHIRWGTYAELVPAPVRTLAPKPPSLSWAEAAALPLAGLTAWQALTSRSGGATWSSSTRRRAAWGPSPSSWPRSSGPGWWARPARPTSPTSAGSAPSRSPTAPGWSSARAVAPDGVTAVLDLVGGEALEASTAVLAEGGRLASVTDAARVRELGGTYWFVRPDADGLATLGRLVEEGRLGVHVERTFPLEEAAAAHRLLEGGHMRGKLALAIG